jgi:hypothetical protein
MGFSLCERISSTSATSTYKNPARDISSDYNVDEET